MKNRFQTLCTIVMLALAVVCIAVNFNVAFMGDTPQAVNITVTVFYLLFWALIMRLEPAAKTSAWMALYSMMASIVALCSILGQWGGFGSTLATVLVFPVSSLFYGIRFIPDFRLLYVVTAIISFIILIRSLITVANKKPQQPKQEKHKEPQQAETPLVPEIVEAEVVAENVENTAEQPAEILPVPAELPAPEDEYDDVTAQTAYETDAQ